MLLSTGVKMDGLNEASKAIEEMNLARDIAELQQARVRLLGALKKLSKGAIEGIVLGLAGNNTALRGSAGVWVPATSPPSEEVPVFLWVEWTNDSGQLVGVATEGLYVDDGFEHHLEVPDNARVTAWALAQEPEWSGWNTGN